MRDTDVKQDADSRLTLDVVAKVVSAQRRGVLSLTMRISSRYPTQVVLEHLSTTDYQWIRKHYPGGAEEVHLVAAVCRKRGRPAQDSMRYLVWLREDESKNKYINDYTRPKLEIWGLLQPHVCTRFTGSVMRDGAPRWTCADYGCKKPVTVTLARQMGLLPPKQGLLEL